MSLHGSVRSVPSASVMVTVASTIRTGSNVGRIRAERGGEQCAGAALDDDVQAQQRVAEFSMVAGSFRVAVGDLRLVRHVQGGAVDGNGPQTAVAHPRLAR
jgi:hypothetical protein